MTDGARMVLQLELLKEKKKQENRSNKRTNHHCQSSKEGGKEDHPSSTHASSQSKAKQANTPANFHFTDFVIYLIMNLACSDKQVT